MVVLYQPWLRLSSHFHTIYWTKIERIRYKEFFPLTPVLSDISDLYGSSCFFYAAYNIPLCQKSRFQLDIPYFCSK